MRWRRSLARARRARDKRARAALVRQNCLSFVIQFVPGIQRKFWVLVRLGETLSLRRIRSSRFFLLMRLKSVSAADQQTRR